MIKFGFEVNSKDESTTNLRSVKIILIVGYGVAGRQVACIPEEIPHESDLRGSDC